MKLLILFLFLISFKLNAQDRHQQIDLMTVEDYTGNLMFRLGFEINTHYNITPPIDIADTSTRYERIVMIAF